ncbi:MULTISPECIES: immunity 17 family protein [Odoribacteraceae]|uniref:immunity 17 family protein n=1 Tax=Odoribacteraceae TaxID=1853231 RepID=UPI000E4E2C77|nr:MULTISPECIES: immunity 17 family protein [Odoribacteraceae]MCQ4874448.1 immunity 17 family protein [Butyricimonas paravirosa]RHR75475.1 hypothetical protein DWW52_17995 [Odoribacter sp. AF15-53]
MKDKDIFSNIPADCVAWLFVGVGVILLIGAIRRWEWVLQMQGTRPFGSLYRLGHIWGEKGYRVGMILISVCIIACGFVLFFLMRQ